jgi:DMSO/TMAO reductase YedYZ molybdopterin-dependent catalytic subunit
MRRLHAVLLSVLLLSLFASAQAPKTILKIDGKIAAPITITAEDWAKLPRATVMAHRGHSKETFQFEGVLLKTLLEKAAVLDPQKELKGKALLQYIVVSASDGYRAIFTLAELDEGTGATNGALLADKMEGKPLDEKAAPLQLIVPTDKRPARSARMVTTITVGSIAD